MTVETKVIRQLGSPSCHKPLVFQNISIYNFKYASDFEKQFTVL